MDLKAMPSTEENRVDPARQTSEKVVAAAPDGAESTEHEHREVFRCHLCPKTFTRRENLSRHGKTHDSPSHYCEICGKGFTRSDLLRRHEAGHERWKERWSQETSFEEPSKRRKVSPAIVESSEMLPNSSWTASTQKDHLLQPSHVALQIRGTYPNIQGQASIPNSSSGNGISPSDHRSVPGYEPYQQPPDVYQMQPGAFSQNHVPRLDAENFSHYNAVDSTVSFDFSSFLLPSDTTLIEQEWFSYDFYSAVQETGDIWDDLGNASYSNLVISGEDYANMTGIDLSISNKSSKHPVLEETVAKHNTAIVEDHEDDHHGARISRESSPPNEASEEDKWPFQWNPNSRQILRAHPIVVPENHLLRINHNPRFDITEATLLRLKTFIQLPPGREFHQSQKSSLVMPSLPVINIFIRLFFEEFSAQMPVLHPSTVNTNRDLPPPLLGAMVVIGATYSHLKHARRFSIILLDILRWHVRIALECDNGLMRDPMIIYTQALICHAGLWCGNKRAFELGEVGRASLVTYIRRAHFGDQFEYRNQQPATEKGKDSTHTSWKRWIVEESQRRLAWVVYGIDCQFPSLLNLPGTINIGEVRNLGCPCDEEFWLASSARNWKNLLGPAIVPPARSFSAALGPFLLVTLAGVDNTMRIPNSRKGLEELPILQLNPWSAFLVLMSLQSAIFQFSQESMIMRTFTDDEETDVNISNEEEDTSVRYLATMLHNSHSIRRGQLSDALALWSKTYLNNPRPSSHPSSRHFHASSQIIYHLSTIILDVPITDLQNAIGKEGLTRISHAHTHLRNWARRNDRISEKVAYNAVKTICLLAPLPNIRDDSIRNIDTAPYSLITIFLCHILLWVFAGAASMSQKLRLLEYVSRNSDLGNNVFLAVLKRGFLNENGQIGTNEGGGEPKVFFRSAAEMLTRLGTWGGSLSMAKLIHERSKIS